MRAFAFCALLISLGLAGCATEPPPLPDNGPIIYACADGTQLQVTFQDNEALVAVVGGHSLALPNRGAPDAPLYTNGRYTLRGRGASASWAVPGGAETACRGR